jgi:Na+(H+)/acetate symporter ActP
VLVVLIGWLYVVPQLQGAGLALRAILGTPIWVGGVVVAATVLVVLAGGGMRSVTLVQGFQYWLKVVAIAVPVIFLIAAWRADGAPSPLTAPAPQFPADTTVVFDTGVQLAVTEPVTVAAEGTIDGAKVSGPITLRAGDADIAAGTRVEFPAGAPVPHTSGLTATTGSQWSAPMAGGDHPMYRTYALMIALFFGTMGLPHVLVRFYTNPDGRAARRTALVVIGLVGLFYLFPVSYGVLGRLYTPELLMTGRTDAVVLLLPTTLIGGTLGTLLGALIAAGAAGAFLATATGLTVSVAGVLSQDIVGRFVPNPVLAFRVAAVAAVAVPLLLGLLASSLPLARAVALAFAVAAATFSPLLLLGIWWPRLTDAGAIAGLITGGTLAVAAILTAIALPGLTGWPSALLSQPAAWALPVSAATMIVVSLLTRRRVRPDVGRIMVRLHTPEAVGVNRTWTARSSR